MSDRRLSAAAQREIQRKHYDAHARRLNPYNLNRYVDKRMAFANLRKDVLPGSADCAQVLDVGCGEGILSQAVSDTGARVVGLDLSNETLKKAEAAVPGFQVVAASANHLPFNAETFDLVVANALFHHLKDPQQALCEMIRVTRRGGHVLVIEPSRRNPLIWMQAASNRVEWRLFLTSKTGLYKATRYHPDIESVQTGAFTDLFYPYRSFPRESLRSAFASSETLLERIGFTTHYYLSGKKRSG